MKSFLKNMCLFLVISFVFVAPTTSYTAPNPEPNNREDFCKIVIGLIEETIHHSNDVRATMESIKNNSSIFTEEEFEKLMRKINKLLKEAVLYEKRAKILARDFRCQNTI